MCVLLSFESLSFIVILLLTLMGVIFCHLIYFETRVGNHGELFVATCILFLCVIQFRCMLVCLSEPVIFDTIIQEMQLYVFVSNMVGFGSNILRC